MNSPHLFDPVVWDTAEELGFDSTGGVTREEFLRTRNDAVPLIAAAQTGDLAAVSVLLSQPDIAVDASGRLGETALHMAAALGYATIVDALICAGAPVDAVDKDGSTPITHCARFCAPERAVSVATLLLAAGADATRETGAHRSTVQWAALAGNAPLVELLLTHSSSPPGSVLADALASRRADVVRAVLQHAPAPDVTDLRPALWCGSWDVFDAVYQKAAPSRDAFTAFASQVLDDLLYEKIPHGGFTIVDVADRFLGQYDADPDAESLAAVLLASGDMALLDVAVKHGLDVKRLGDAQLSELLAEARGRKAPPEFELRAAALREERK
ncbi:ankyrin [Auricularia subglabra TFB-10046 SS5]|nr:ankyrin [Auricularia subglabra TFB-10046 SS5]